MEVCLAVFAVGGGHVVGGGDGEGARGPVGGPFPILVDGGAVLDEGVEGVVVVGSARAAGAFLAGDVAVDACHLGQQNPAGTGHGVFKQLEQFGIGDAEHIELVAEGKHVVDIADGDVARGLPVEGEVGADVGTVEEGHVGLADALHDVAHPVAHDRGTLSTAVDEVVGGIDGDMPDDLL